MTPRNCQEVIKQMIELIPSAYGKFIKDLEWNYEDSFYKSPEETIQWERTSKTLQKHIPNPSTVWEYEVLHIFTTIPVAELRAMTNN